MRSQRELASTVERRRHQLGITQAELAQRAGVSRQWVNALEAAEGNPSFANLVAVLDALGLGLEIAEIPAVHRPAVAHPDLDDLVNRHRAPLPQPPDAFK